MDPGADAAAATFAADGFLVLEGVLAPEIVEVLRLEGLAHWEELLALLADRGLPLGIGIKEGYREVVQRHPHRYEVPYKMDSATFESAVLGSALLMKTVHAILGDDCHIVNKSLLMSLPGAEDQSWHVDGGHLSLTEDLPCHCMNVFLPLIDVQREHGPTELRLGSQWLTRDLKKQYMRAFLTKKLRGTSAPCLSAGSALLFDYRTLHRGLANTSGIPRPVLVYTFAKPYFSDRLNFPHASVHDEAAAVAALPLPHDESAAVAALPLPPQPSLE